MPKTTADEKTSLTDNNIFLFMDEFEPKTVSPAIEFILEKNLSTKENRPKHLTLIICSPGGELTSAFALIDVMNGSNIPVHTVGIGQISSCGILTFMSGAKGHRTLTPNTSILSHQWSWGSFGKSHELIAVQREFELTDERMMEHYRRCTGLEDKIIKKVLLPANDVWLTAQQAVKYGIADNIKHI